MRPIAESGSWDSARVAVSAADESISVDGLRTSLDRRSTAILLALIESSGAPVSKNELMARAWPNRVLHENSIAKAISKLRATLEGSGLEIATVHGFGYRLKEILPTEQAAAEANPHQPLSAAASAMTAQGVRLALAASAVFLVVLAIAGWSAAIRAPGATSLIPVRTAPHGQI